MNFIYVGVLNYSAAFRVYSLLQRQLQLIRIRTAIPAGALASELKFIVHFASRCHKSESDLLLSCRPV